MRHETAESLPSLACPLIVNPSNGAEKSEHGKFLPPFPEIDLLNYDGFHFSHLHWVGIKLAEGRIPDLKSGEVKSAIDHEFCHKELARTPFSHIGNYEMVIFYGLIHETFEENEEQIPVPLSHDLARNELEKQWERVVRFKSAALLIEEVYAVRSSLRQALEQDFIKDNKEFRKQRRQYKRAYGQFIPGYGAIYNLFDFVARQIGESAANAIIHNVLETASPKDMFLEILFYLCQIGIRVPIKDFLENPSDDIFGWVLSEEETKAIKALSFEQAYNCFSNLIDELDPDDSCYRRKDVLDQAVMSLKQEGFLSQYAKDEVAKFIFSSPTAMLCTFYNENVYPFYKIDVSEKGEICEEVEDGNFTILLEAIRQQLTQGIGLLCPFWLLINPSLQRMGSRLIGHSCCGGRNRAFLEKVWSCTSKSSCKYWTRLGCLM